ncbi:MAG: ferrous iron transport protein A [Aquificota bacterium]|nr:MAG: ferrous iron transport protein A [Aquificota bacterium]
MRLIDIEDGKTCKIKKVNLESGLKKKFLELGLFPGQIVSVVQKAPFGGPVKIKVRDYCLALRPSEAAKIEVSECDGTK